MAQNIDLASEEEEEEEDRSRGSDMDASGTTRRAFCDKLRSYLIKYV